jgi:hypothetical protein
MAEVTRRYRAGAIAAVVCLLTFSIYTASLAPTITWRHDGADSGDLATAVALGRVPHPSGYPTYLLLAGLFNKLPLGDDVAYRLNLMSATCAALAVVFLYLAAKQTLTALLSEDDAQAADPAHKQRRVSYEPVQVSAAIVAALTFAFSRLFWSQAIITEVYALNSLFVALLLWLALRVRAGSSSHMGWLCLTAGLALGNHLLVAAVLPLVLALIWPAYWRQSPRRRLGTFLPLVLGLGVYAIIPWRAMTPSPMNWGGAHEWAGFRWLVTAQAYRGYMLGLPWTYAGERILALVQIILQSLAWWGLPLALWGWRLMIRYDRLLAVGSLLTVALITMYAVGYNTADSYLYLLPALMVMSLWLAWGVSDLLRLARPNRLQARIAWGLLALPAVLVALNFPSMSLRHDRAAIEFAETTLRQAAPDALILVEEDRYTFALWYVHYALGQRPDVAIVNVNLLGYDWYRLGVVQANPDLSPAQEVGSLIQQNIDVHPVYAIGDALRLPSQFMATEDEELQGVRKVSEAVQR